MVVQLLEDAVQAIARIGAPGKGGQGPLLAPWLGIRQLEICLCEICRCEIWLQALAIGFSTLFEGLGGGAMAAMGPAGVATAPPDGVEAAPGHGAAAEGRPFEVGAWQWAAALQWAGWGREGGLQQLDR